MAPVTVFIQQLIHFNVAYSFRVWELPKTETRAKPIISSLCIPLPERVGSLTAPPYIKMLCETVFYASYSVAKKPDNLNREPMTGKLFKAVKTILKLVVAKNIFRQLEVM
jgi:hypothetical protein